MNKNIPYGRQYIDQSDIDAVVETLQHDFLTQGPKVVEFEQKFAEYIGSKYAVAVANGTAALHLCALALDVKPGETAVTSPITFAASANCIRYCGGDVVFADIDPNSLLIDLHKLEEILQQSNHNIKGVIPVDFAGFPVNLEELRILADKYNLWIIEDACHAPGGFFTDSKGMKQNCGNGNFADLAIFSFHPVKHIACGEGGMITTNRKDLYEKLLLLRTHGITKDISLMNQNDGGWYYEMQTLGYNYRMPDILCALGISQLDKAEAGLKRRRAIAEKYDLAFKNTQVQTILPPSDGGHAYHLYVIKVKNRKEVYDKLKSVGIHAQVHYVPVHKHPYYKNLYNKNWDVPQSELYYEQCLSIPMYPTLTNEEQDFVISNVLAFAHA
jgi:UDP-4-amino-4,6-dideoxy-N-acetyl-beta-L-altrosamine transaminase